MDEPTTPQFEPARNVHHRRRTPLWRSKKVLAAAVVAVLILAGLGWFFFIRDTSVPGADQTKIVSIDGTSFTYPGNWQRLQITNSDKKVNVILKLVNTKPSGSFVWRSLKGELAKSVDVLTLPDQIAATLTGGLDGVEVLSKEVAKIGSFDAVKIVYIRPDSKDAKKTYKSLMYVVPRPNQTHYLTFTVAEGDFDKLEPGFTKILDSFNGYITAHP